MSSQVSHHLLLCATSKKGQCCNPVIGEASWNELKQLLKQLKLDNPNRPEGVVLRSKVDCLRICKEGPILLIWPEGIWYREVTPERIKIIVHSHIIKGKPLNDWIIQKTPQAQLSQNLDSEA